MDELFESPSVVFRIFGIPITETIVISWVVMGVLICLALFFRRKFDLYPGKLQNIIETIVDAFSGLVTSTMGEKRVGFMPYMATLFMFISFANLVGLFGLRPPTADINMSLGLGIMTFFAIHFYGLKFKGFGHIKGFTQPVILFLPVNIISEFSKPISLSFRLFGNILGGALIMALIGGAVSLFVPVLPSLYFELFVGVLQSFIFVMLTMVFITLAIE